jgi:alpha-L-fucosidase
MKKNLLLVVVILCAISCKQPNEIVLSSSSTIEINETDTNDSIIIKAAHVIPTQNQYKALKDEFIAFIHFGPNTFTRMEWGSGMEDPKIFNLQNLDTDQWCEAMKAAGMKKVILTVKHHDGFCLWQTRYTTHGVMSTPFKNGKGDILKELAESCEKYGLKLGVYLSPADLYQIENSNGLYGNLSKYTERVIPRAVEGRPFKNKTTFKFKVDDYNEYFLNQLFELLTEYGPIHEVWFDGAHPKRKGNQQYNYLAWKELIHKLAPEAVIFGKQDVRWCGNEAGKTRDTEWNVIPYQEDPATMNRFGDLTVDSLGHREQLYKGKYLHYQQAETNTSIREGWFYRDETDQKVRSADDIFDMYERSVGGNSTFLLNIPPNREGTFSNRDYNVLKDVGQRIAETYNTNLFKAAKGPHELLDENEESHTLLNNGDAIVITTPKPITTNRLIIQEAIMTHSERVEKHVLEAWLDNNWKEIAAATNIGYKRILRFPEITTDKFRISILQSRLQPAISKVSAHYYKPRPPQITIQRNTDGLVTLKEKTHEFRWKPHGEDVSKNINSGYEIRYTLDGSKPTRQSKLYDTPFSLPNGEVKACAFTKNQTGSVSSNLFGIIKKNWKVINSDSEQEENKTLAAFDNNVDTYWKSNNNKEHYIAFDLGEAHNLKGFSYTPQTENSEGMIESGIIEISNDGKSWNVLENFKFGNLINDPTKRNYFFKKVVNTRYIKIISTTIAGDYKNAAIAEIGFLK